MFRGYKKTNTKNKLILFALSLFILSSLVAGYTYSVVAPPQNGWFTDQDNTTNTFKAGSLMIDVDDPDLFDAEFSNAKDTISFDPCAGLSYSITNTGTKRNYIRAKFEGHWVRDYHLNTATAKVETHGLSAEDSAHFNYGDGIQTEPDYTAEREPDAVGFTDELVLGPVVFSQLPAQNEDPVSDYSFSGNHSIENYDNGSGNQTGESTAEGEKFSFEAQRIANLADGLLNELFGPDCLDEGFKLLSPVSDEGDLASESEIWDQQDDVTVNDGDFEITISKNDDDTFDFNSNFPVFHMFVKGGAQGSNLYTYYVDDDKVQSDGINDSNYVSTTVVESEFSDSKENPFLPEIEWISDQYDSENSRVDIDLEKLSTDLDKPNNQGVYSGYGLDAATDKGWSHITVYYCEPQLEPGLDLIKLVKVSENGSWYTSQEFADTDIINALNDTIGGIEFYNYSNEDTWPVAQDQDWPPQFKIVVANTGDLTLNNINVTDDYFLDFDRVIYTLDPGQLWISDTIIYSGFLDELETSMVLVKIADSDQIPEPWNPELWHPYSQTGPNYQQLGEYFYHQQVLQPEDIIPLYVNVCLNPENLGKEYSGAVFKLYAFFEAIQYTNQMDEKNWSVTIPIE